MSSIDKLLARFFSSPKDFTWSELVRVFSHFGYTQENKGSTSGSRVGFRKGDRFFITHKPHPSNIIKPTALRNAIQFIKTNEK